MGVELVVVVGPASVVQLLVGRRGGVTETGIDVTPFASARGRVRLSGVDSR